MAFSTTLFRGNRDQPRYPFPGSTTAGLTGASLREDTTPPTRESKERLINFHVSTINAILRAKGRPELSSGDYSRIQAAAEHSTATNSESIMQAVLGAASTALPNDAQATFKQQLAEKGIDEAAYYNAIAKFGASLGSFDAIVAAARGLRNGNMSGSGWENGQANYSSVAVANFSVSNGVVSGMTPQLYREHFQAYYGANQQGQFTASRVAGVLASNEGLTGAALVRRTKEVGHDTRDRLGLDTNRFAPIVAHIGKKYSEPAVEHKGLLDQALQAQQSGDQPRADELMWQFYEKRKQEEDRAKKEDPDKAAGVGAISKGLFSGAVENGLKPTQVQADMLRFDGNKNDPAAVAQHEAMLKKVSETPRGKVAVDAYRADLARAAEEKKISDKGTAVAVVTNNAKVDDLDGLAAPVSSEPVKDGAKPVVKAEAEPPKDKPVQEAKKEPAKKEEPKKVAAATNGQAAGPV